jgi:hypothetical protein
MMVVFPLGVGELPFAARKIASGDPIFDFATEITPVTEGKGAFADQKERGGKYLKNIIEQGRLISFEAMAKKLKRPANKETDEANDEDRCGILASQLIGEK